VETVVDPPFGVDAPQRSSVTFTLAPGAALVAITDGLVERRDADIDVGIQLVLDAAGNSPTGANRLLQRIVAGAGSGSSSGPGPDSEQEHDDDVTALVLRRRMPDGTR
jgi:hypothetical protein